MDDLPRDLLDIDKPIAKEISKRRRKQFGLLSWLLLWGLRYCHWRYACRARMEGKMVICFRAWVGWRIEEM